MAASTKSHIDSCKKNRSAYFEKKAAFIVKWRNYCRKCGGLGGKYSMFDPSPSGVGLSLGYMTEFEECQDCLAQEICPRCGFNQVDIGEHWEDVVCENCEWDQHEAEMDMHGKYCMPEEPDCNCFEMDYDITEQELEERSELEIDLANDPDRRARRGDADEALFFVLGSDNED